MRAGVCRRIATFGLGSALLAGIAPAAADYFGEPSIAAATVDDDNLFFAATDRQQDSILRVSPAFEGGYLSEALTWRGTLGVDAERYEQHAELDSDQAREAAALDVQGRTAQRLAFSMNTSYLKTRTPGELAPDTGIEFERREAERFTLTPALAYPFDRRTSGFAGYGFTHDALAGAPGTDTHEVMFGVGRRGTRRDTASLEYRYRRFEAAGETRPSHALLAGVIRRFSDRTTGSLSAGPRLAEGSMDLEAAASLRQALPGGEWSLDYARGETTVIGLADTATTQSIGGHVAATIGSAIEWRLASALASTEGGGGRADTLTLDLGFGVRVMRLVSVVGAYAYREQRGRLDTSAAERIERNVVMLGVVIRAPEREEREEGRASRTRNPSMRDRPWMSQESDPAEEEEKEEEDHE